MFCFPVYDRATLIALSTASDPLLQKKYLLKVGGTISFRCCTRLIEASVAGRIFCWAKMILFACSWIAWMTLGCECPVEVTPIPLVKSKSCLPDVSQTWQPDARSATISCNSESSYPSCACDPKWKQWNKKEQYKEYIHGILQPTEADGRSHSKACETTECKSWDKPYASWQVMR